MWHRLFVVDVFVKPLFEELLFRVLLFDWLRVRLGIKLAVVLSALVFAFAHPILLFLGRISSSPEATKIFLRFFVKHKIVRQGFLDFLILRASRPFVFGLVAAFGYGLLAEAGLSKLGFFVVVLGHIFCNFAAFELRKREEKELQEELNKINKLQKELEDDLIKET